MNIKFLLDTNIISESIKLQPNHIFLERFRRNLEESAIASVTWHELLYGLYRLPESRRKKILSDYLTQDDINRLSNHLHMNAQIEIFPDAISGERW